MADPELVGRLAGEPGTHVVAVPAERTGLPLAAARNVGAEAALVSGATAYHQWHPTQSPPVGHLDDILRNGALFARRWGWWPMEGWIDAFADQGLIRWDPTKETYVRTTNPQDARPGGREARPSLAGGSADR